MNKDDKILITGCSGMLGRALWDELAKQGYTNVTTPARGEVDLTSLTQTIDCFVRKSPNYVFHLAGYVQGIGGNMADPARAFEINNFINTNVIIAARSVQVCKILAMGSGAIYADLPYAHKEHEIWLDKPGAAEYGYAQAKRAMLAHLEVATVPFAYVVSANLYGPHDRFNVETGHVIPSLIRKFHLQAHPSVWGTGSAIRDFMYVKDAARALVQIMHTVEGPINMGSGVPYQIAEVVELLETRLEKKALWDATKPEGAACRIYNIERLDSIGFKTEYDLYTGLKETWEWYCDNHKSVRQ